MTCNIIATGSKGNAIVLNDTILLDCGVSFSKLEDVYKKLQIVFLTHQHTDHVNQATVRRLHKERPSLRFACCKWMVGTLLNAGVNRSKIDVCTVGAKLCYGYRKQGIIAKPIEIMHDIPNCAWDLNVEGETVFYCTDCGTVDGIEVPNRNLYLIEGNYKEDEIKERMLAKTESGEFTYEARVERYHLSEEQALRFLSENAGPSSKYVLIHRHNPKT